MSESLTTALPQPNIAPPKGGAAEFEPKIKRLIAAELRLSEDLLEGDLTIEDLGFDSLTSAEVLLAIEKQLNCSLNAASLVESLSPDTPVQELISAAAEAAAQSTSVGSPAS